MKTKYIIFDKDGTLMDFEKFWVKILDAATKTLLEHYGADLSLAKDIYAILGVVDGIVNINGTYCQGESGKTCQAFYDVLTQNGYEVDKDELSKLAGDVFIKSYSAGEIAPNCRDLRGLLTNFRQMGIGIAMVTADGARSTNMTLERLGVADCFDEIFVADHIHPGKPDPYYINALCADKGITTDEVIMVGDTLKDMKFAENAGVKAIGIAKNETNRAILAPHAAAVVDSLDKITEYIEL